MKIETDTYEGDEVEVVEDPISPTEFERRYANVGKPALFRKLLNWPAFEKWSADYLSEKLSQSLGCHGDENELFYSCLGNYVSCLQGERRLSFYANQQSPPPQNLKPDVPTPTHVPSKQLLRERMWFGPIGSATPMHADGYHNLIVVVQGQKRFQLISQRHAGKFSYQDVHIAYGRYPQIDLSSLPDGARIVEVTVGAGECLFLPLGWFHAVTNVTHNIMIQYWWRGPDHLVANYASSLRKSGSDGGNLRLDPDDFLKGVESELEIVGRQNDLQIAQRLFQLDLPHRAWLFCRRWINDISALDEQNHRPTLVQQKDSFEAVNLLLQVFSDGRTSRTFEESRALCGEILEKAHRLAELLPRELVPQPRHGEYPGVEEHDLAEFKSSSQNIHSSREFLSLRDAVRQAKPRGSSFRTAYQTPTLLVWHFEERAVVFELYTDDPVGSEPTAGTITSDEVDDLPFLWGLSMYSTFDLEDVLSWYRACGMTPSLEKLELSLQGLISQSLVVSRD